jgi:cellulose biosynthesis protein BcsQ/tetratricopeptide (TPR) repeat protein
MSTPHSALASMDRPCPFITFYSFKGGVGRSMAVINVAGILAARGFRVLVIDMDLEAPGISYLANEANQAQDRVQPGFVDFLLDAVERDAEADLFKLSPDEALGHYAAAYQLPDAFLKAPGGSLHIMPAGRLDAEYPSRLDRLDLPSLYREGSGLALVKVFKDVVQQSRRFDYVFIDSRTGFSDESGICTRDLADYLMVVSGLNKQNVEGTTQFLAALGAASPERKPLAVILSPVPNGEDALVDAREQTAQLAFKAAWGSDVHTNLHIPYHPQLALTEEPHIFRRGKGYLFDAYCQIEKHLLGMLGETPEARTREAIAALKIKEYAAAAALLRRASMVADTSEWIDGFTLELASPHLPDVGEAEALYNFVVEHATPRALQHLGNMMVVRAVDLWRIEEEVDAAESMFRLALTAAPAEAENLGFYAAFLGEERKDLDAAEVMYKRAFETDPNHARNLCNYAVFLHVGRKDRDAAEAMFKRAIEAAPGEGNNLGNYGRLCLETGRIENGMQLVERAIARLRKTRPNELDAECWMYVYCCGAEDRRPAALAHLRRLVEVKGIKTGSWDFSGVIRQAERMQHPEEAWLSVLAEVVAGRQPSTALDPWAAWGAAKDESGAA